MANGYTIREAGAADRSEWDALWSAYLEFYESALPERNTEVLWERIIDRDHPIRCLVAAAPAGDLAGMVQFFPHLDTWEVRPVCYLQDLYVIPQARRKGLGQALVETVKQVAVDDGWQLIYWMTSRDNEEARRLYDRLAGGEVGHVVYQLGQGSDRPIDG